MLWIIMFIVSGLFAVVFLCKHHRNRIENKYSEEYTAHAATFIASAIVSVFVVLIQLGIGMTDYPYLVKKQAAIKSLENRIEDIRGSSYAYGKDGNFVAGSIENMNQSTNLSKYIADLAEKEAHYNSYLAEAKIYKEMFVLYFFGYGWAISDKIYTL